MTQADAKALRTIHNYHIHKILFPREIKKYSAILDEALEKQIPKKNQRRSKKSSAIWKYISARIAERTSAEER